MVVGVCVAGALGGGAVAGAQRESGGEPFTIYSSLPLQGDSRPQSADVTRAIRMALRDNGGRAGRHRITYISLDDASPAAGAWVPERVAVNARKAAANPRTIAYVGEFNSGASAVSMPILNRAGVLQVSPSNTIVGLTRAVGARKGEPARYYPTGRRTYGRIIPTDYVQGPAVVSYMKDKGCASAYIVNNRDLYGQGIAAQVERVGKLAGHSDPRQHRPRPHAGERSRRGRPGQGLGRGLLLLRRLHADQRRRGVQGRRRRLSDDATVRSRRRRRVRVHRAARPGAVQAGVHHQPDAGARGLPAARAALLRGLQGEVRAVLRSPTRSTATRR